jgi:hypothetical protein
MAHTKKTAHKPAPKTAPAKTAPKNPPAAVPQGYDDAPGDSDLSGFWEDNGRFPAHFELVGYKLTDSKLDETKTSILIVARAVDSVQLSDGTACAPGETFGIWGKPGMRALASLFGCRVWLLCTGEKDTGKQNPMRVYTVKCKPARGEQPPLLGDHRKESKHSRPWIAGDAPQGRAAPASDTNGDVEPWA